MLPDRVSNPGPLTYESGALPIALRGPARTYERTNGQTSRRKLYTPRHKCRGYNYIHILEAVHNRSRVIKQKGRFFYEKWENRICFFYYGRKKYSNNRKRLSHFKFLSVR